MREENCNACHKEIEVTEDYKPEYCCSGYECGCYGLPTNPVFCDECERELIGVAVE
ncbi:hypothetical protein [Planococcus beigongshangi]|uniref:hypothetical protein n=1 Tax=Planococcus beigongshangi TaxID=2782536 RepID=UPI00193C16B6|nr:hypothetical protein [Planococcus beigongshangi]